MGRLGGDKKTMKEGCAINQSLQALGLDTWFERASFMQRQEEAFICAVQVFEAELSGVAWGRACFFGGVIFFLACSCFYSPFGRASPSPKTLIRCPSISVARPGVSWPRVPRRNRPPGLAWASRARSLEPKSIVTNVTNQKTWRKRPRIA